MYNFIIVLFAKPVMPASPLFGRGWGGFTLLNQSTT